MSLIIIIIFKVILKIWGMFKLKKKKEVRMKSIVLCD